jgi:hypothetical protein
MAAPLLRKINEYLRSPRGQRTVAQARQAANRPEVRQRLATLMQRLRGSRRR